MKIKEVIIMCMQVLSLRPYSRTKDTILSSKTRSSSGFSLIEMLVAMVISSIILLAMYSIISQVASSKDVVDRNSETILKQVKLTQIINKDFRQGYLSSFTDGNITLSRGETVDAFLLSTQNSLFFNSAVKVKVAYYLDPSGWLVRVEEEEDMQYYNAFPLLPSISSFSLSSYDVTNSTYTDEVDLQSDLFNFNIVMDDNTSFNVTVPSNMLNRN